MKTSAVNRIFFGLALAMGAIVLNSCSTVHTTMTTKERVRAPTQSAPAPATSYQYGRFTVKSTESGQQVIGGTFVPPASLPTAVTPGHRHVIFISYQTKELMYYRREGDGDFVPVIGYAVVTPDARSLSQGVVRGRVTRIDLAPTWCPTENIRRARSGLPVGCLPFGHPQNAMGAVKFEIVWQGVRGWEYNRLHGTSGYPRGSFWEEETFGCTRLVNDAVLQLVQELGGPGAVREGIEVIAHRLPGGKLVQADDDKDKDKKETSPSPSQDPPPQRPKRTMLALPWQWGL